MTLGILTAIGGFLDIGDLVTNAVVGSRFGLGLAWVVPVGVLRICLFAQMSGRVAAVSGRATFEIIRDRLGPRAALANLGASFFVQPGRAGVDELLRGVLPVSVVHAARAHQHLFGALGPQEIQTVTGYP